MTRAATFRCFDGLIIMLLKWYQMYTWEQRMSKSLVQERNQELMNSIEDIYALFWVQNMSQQSRYHRFLTITIIGYSVLTILISSLCITLYPHKICCQCTWQCRYNYLSKLICFVQGNSKQTS